MDKSAAATVVNLSVSALNGIDQAVADCAELIDAPLDADLREQVQRSLDLLRDARDSMEFVYINTEADDGD